MLLSYLFCVFLWYPFSKESIKDLFILNNNTYNKLLYTYVICYIYIYIYYIYIYIYIYMYI